MGAQVLVRVVEILVDDIHHLLTHGRTRLCLFMPSVGSRRRRRCQRDIIPCGGGV
jgi:hypothetical protein